MDDQWRCPGCDRPYDELPEGHTYTVGVLGKPPAGYRPTCSDPTPVSPQEFMSGPTSRPGSTRDGRTAGTTKKG